MNTISLSINKYEDSPESLLDWVKAATFTLTHLFIQIKFSINKRIPHKWLKPETVDALQLIQEYYGYSIEKARQVLPLFSDAQLLVLKEKLNKGGIK